MSDLRQLYSQSAFPLLQNRVYDTPTEAKACLTGDIELVQDMTSGFIYNAVFNPETMIYDSSYNNEQGGSSRFREHLHQVKDIVEAGLGKKGLIEVGCGKGFFLNYLLQNGFEVTGFDPSYEGDSDRIVKSYFEPGLLEAFRGLILRHVLEHVPDPLGFLYQLKRANGGEGLIYIEVPCFDWICKKRAWFDVFYEHVNYFRLSDFHRMFSRVEMSGRLFGDQYLYVVADLAALRDPSFDSADALRFPADFVDGVGAAQQAVLDQPCGVWGGASKGVIFSLLLERAGSSVSLVVDVNPAKQFKFLPGTGLEVVSPEIAMRRLPKNAPMFVMNGNYMDEIKVQSDHQFHYIGIDQ